LASLGHPSKFQQVSRLAFVTAATSLTGGQPNFARCLAISWAGTLYIHCRELLSRQNCARCNTDFTSKSCVLLYWQRDCTALQQRATAKLCGVVQGMELNNFREGRHLYLAGRPSRWALAHILVLVYFCLPLSLHHYYSASLLLVPWNCNRLQKVDEQQKFLLTGGKWCDVTVVFGRPFVKQSALGYRSVVCLSPLSCL